MYKCPVCNSNKCNIYKIIKNFRLLSCLNCSMVFIDPLQISPEYDNQYKKNISSPMLYYKNIEEYDERSFIKRLHLLDKYFPQKGTLFEVGSNTGTFLE